MQLDLINPTLIGLFGESFGGAMALCHCARDKRIKALAIRSPVFDTEMVPTLPFFNDLMRIWARNKQMRFPQGNVNGMYKEQTSLYNPIKLAPIINLPVFIVGGDSDKILTN
ncbi:MAG: prolyl oligopeptidase family serine peptidase [Candidatus Lokiarchaeota archaeon]